jgi:hypothetical protein
MNKLFENWNRYLKEEAPPIDPPNPFEDLISRFNTLTDPEGGQLPFYADIQAGQGVDSPYVYIIDHRRNDRVIARFRTPESFQKAIKKAESEATHPDLDPLDYSAEFGEQLNLVAREQLKVWSDK